MRDKTGRRILFYRTSEAVVKEEKPDMAVFHMGVPDASPEVLSEKEMENYFETTMNYPAASSGVSIGIFLMFSPQVARN